MILVTGASGYIGSRAVCRLLELGLSVTACGRNGARVRQAVPPSTLIATADYNDPESLDRAFAKVRKLLFVASDGFAEDVLRQHSNVIEAANRSSIEHVVFTSIIDVEESSPFYFAPVYRDAEQKLKTARFSASIIRCGLYSEFILRHWLGDSLISLPLGSARIAPVSRDDVVAAAVEALLHTTGEVQELSGARSYSMIEIAAAASSAFGKAFAYQTCTPEEYFERLQREEDAPWPTAFSSLCASIREGLYANTSMQSMKALSRSPEDFGTFLARYNSDGIP